MLVGQIPEQSGHTRLPQPPAIEHRENVLMSLTLEPNPSMIWTSSAAAALSESELDLAILRRASSYTQHAVLQTGHLPRQ